MAAADNSLDSTAAADSLDSTAADDSLDSTADDNLLEPKTNNKGQAFFVKNVSMIRPYLGGCRTIKVQKYYGQYGI